MTTLKFDLNFATAFNTILCVVLSFAFSGVTSAELRPGKSRVGDNSKNVLSTRLLIGDIDLTICLDVLFFSFSTVRYDGDTVFSIDGTFKRLDATTLEVF